MLHTATLYRLQCFLGASASINCYNFWTQHLLAMTSGAGIEQQLTLALRGRMQYKAKLFPKLWNSSLNCETPSINCHLWLCFKLAICRPIPVFPGCSRSSSYVMQAGQSFHLCAALWVCADPDIFQSVQESRWRINHRSRELSRDVGNSPCPVLTSKDVELEGPPATTFLLPGVPATEIIARQTPVH